MNRSQFRLFDRLRVRWSEVDSQRIVFNGHYLTYLDTAIAAYWRALAMPYAETMAQLDGDLFVRKATLDYRDSARYDDVLDVGMRCARVGKSSMLFDGAIFRQDRLLVCGELVYVFADPQARTSRPVPQSLRDVFLGFEAGEPMVRLQLGSWDEIGEAALRLRTQVFVDEQQVPAGLERDAADPQALHALALNRFGLALATGRLLQHAPGVARIGRMAVIASMRGSGVGRQVLEALLQAARARGDRQALLHSQTRAAGFYRRAGFAAQGEVFVEAGIEHIEMALGL